jgi:hypothetical protein
MKDLSSRTGELGASASDSTKGGLAIGDDILSEVRHETRLCVALSFRFTGSSQVSGRLAAVALVIGSYNYRGSKVKGKVTFA